MTADPLVAREVEPSAQTRPMYWSIRRELWENRSVYAAPVVTACIMLFGFFISAITLPHRMRAAMADPGKLHGVVAMPYDTTAGLILVTAFLVGVFYCLDALHGERRDRSILFWKSLPVSDRTTVLAKIAIPLVILPLFSYAVILVTQLIILTANTIVLLGNSSQLAALYQNLKFVQLSIALLYAVIAIALWHAPLYCWLLLVSGWAKRAVFLWAVMPFLAIGVFTKIAFGSASFFTFLGDRLAGWFNKAFIAPQKGAPQLDPLAAMTPGTFLSTPSLWLGLVFAALCLAATIRMRRYREPM
ncbi:MAG: ABC transporter permease [Acidobacteria bacterium]|nr:ABC transporter permease [Acidobacteriota bacterium]MBV9069032.1 ABC transporter permease [Acidobacteriota bacterium]MBV9184172.1 ABC transporter permease [Acidobacteriota bacterium]